MDLRTDDVWGEIRRAEDWRKKGLARMEELIRDIHGPAYEERQTARYRPENVGFEYLSLMLPQIAYSRPDVVLGTTNMEAENDSIALEGAVNRWAAEAKLVRLTERVGVDFLLNWGGTVTEPVARPGSTKDRPRYWPQVYHLSQKEWGWDPKAKSWEDRLYSFHAVITDHDKLIERARRDRELPPDQREGWNLEAIERMQHGAGVSEIRHGDGDGSTSGVRREVVYYVFHAVDAKVDEANTEEDGFSGAVCTLAYGSDGEEPMKIRDDFDWYGPVSGPHQLFGMYTIPLKSRPLTALTATYQQQEEYNMVSRANDESGRKYKRVIASEDEDFVRLLKEASHDFAYHVPGLTEKQWAQMEIAGLTDQMLTQEMRLRDQVDRNLGITDAQRGNLSGDATATENAIANAASNSRQGYVIKKFREAWESNLEKVLWYFHNDDRMYQVLGPETKRRLGVPPQAQVAIQGGGWKTRFEDLELTISINSMGRRTREQKQAEAMQFLQGLSMIGQLAMTNPAVDFQDLLPILDEELEQPFTKTCDVQVLTLLQMMATQGMIQQPPQGEPDIQPRMGVTMGQTRSDTPRTMKPQDSAPDGLGSSATQVRMQGVGA